MDAQASWVDETIQDVLAYLHRASDLFDRLVIVDDRSHVLTASTRGHVERAALSIKGFIKILIGDLESIHRGEADGPP